MFTAEEMATILQTDTLEEEAVSFSDDSCDAEDSDPEFVPAEVFLPSDSDEDNAVNTPPRGDAGDVFNFDTDEGSYD